MELVYAALLLHAGKQKVNEENVKKVIDAAGIQTDHIKIKALVAALENVNIDEAISKAAMPVPPVEAKAEKKEEKKEEDVEKKAEEAAAGLASLFG